MKKPDYRYLLGPVPSRRFGRSLGIDLTPHKTCSLDCVFCQLGRTQKKTLTRKMYTPTDAVIEEIRNWLDTDGEADYLTLSGSGEPTLHAAFGRVLEFLRQQTIPSVLLTNGTLFSEPEVREAAMSAHGVKVSLSAWDQQSFEWVNRPHREIRFGSTLKGLRQFRSMYAGQLWLEVFLLSGLNAMQEDVRKIAQLARQVNPDRIHLNTVVRPPAEGFAAAVPMEQLGSVAGLFDPPAQIAAGVPVQPSNQVPADESRILSMLRRRPCTIKQIEAAFGMHINEVSKVLGHLMHSNRVRADLRERDVYYTCR